MSHLLSPFAVDICFHLTCCLFFLIFFERLSQPYLQHYALCLCSIWAHNRMEKVGVSGWRRQGYLCVTAARLCVCVCWGVDDVFFDPATLSTCDILP